MRSFIQITDTTNDILRSLPLGNLSSNTTYSFRVWNNLPQVDGIAALNGLKLNLMYPPKQGIKTLINQDTIQIRCTYSGKRSETISSSFQSFPIENDEYNRLEPNCYNEYEVQIDFSTLSSIQKTNVEQIEMEYNITATYDIEYVPLSLPSVRAVYSNTYIDWSGRTQIDVISQTLMRGRLFISPLSDTRILNTYVINSLSDSAVLNDFTIDIVSISSIFSTTVPVIFVDSNTAIYRTGFDTISVTSDSAIDRMGGFFIMEIYTDTKIIGVLTIDLASDSIMTVLDNEITNVSDTDIIRIGWFRETRRKLTDTRIKYSPATDAPMFSIDSNSWINIQPLSLYQGTDPRTSDTAVKVLGQNPPRLIIESNTRIATP